MGTSGISGELQGDGSVPKKDNTRIVLGHSLTKYNDYSWSSRGTLDMSAFSIIHMINASKQAGYIHQNHT